MTAQAVLRTTALSAGYHGVPAISNVSIEVASGEMVALLGANGAGKTTTLMSLVGKAQVLSGHIDVLGKRRTRGAAHKHAKAGLGIITERRCVFASLTCRENLLLGRGEVDKALAHFPELEPLLKTKAGLMSGGEQQMLAVGRVLSAEPRLILADEVSLGLAPLVVKRLLAALRAAADRGAAVLLVEQHPMVALRSVDRAYVLRRGSVALEGSAAELRERGSDLATHYL